MIRHATRKKMILEQIAKTQSFAKRLGYLQGATIFCGGVDNYLYCCPNNLEINVCCFMMDNIGYPKLEFGLSVMPFEDFSNCLAYTSLKVGIFCFGFINF